jgi:hypothetical protein
MTEHDFGPELTAGVEQNIGSEPTEGIETVARRKTLLNTTRAAADSPITGPYIRFGTYIGNNDVCIKHHKGPDTIEHVGRLMPGEEIKPGDEVVVNNRPVRSNETGKVRLTAFLRQRRGF